MCIRDSGQADHLHRPRWWGPGHRVCICPDGERNKAAVHGNRRAGRVGEDQQGDHLDSGHPLPGSVSHLYLTNRVEGANSNNRPVRQIAEGMGRPDNGGHRRRIQSGLGLDTIVVVAALVEATELPEPQVDGGHQEDQYRQVGEDPGRTEEPAGALGHGNQSEAEQGVEADSHAGDLGDPSHG